MSIFDQLERITGIDLSTGQRGVQPMKEVIKKSKVRKIQDLSEVSDVYGGLDKLPDSLEPVRGLDIKKGRISGDRAAVVDLNPDFQFKGLGKDEEIRQIEYSGLGGSEPKYEIVKKNAPYAGIPRTFAGAIDAVTGNTFGLDLDKRGKRGDKKRIVDINDPSNYLVPQAQKSKVESALESAGVDTTGGTTGAIPEAKEMLDFLEQNTDRIRNINRDLARGAALDEAATFALTEPLRQKFLRDASTFKQRQLLEAERIKQAMPNAIQNRLLSADVGFAQQAGAIAGQQDAATRFANLGNQRQFGQNVVYTPPLLRG